jgi:hypothetical protein
MAQAIEHLLCKCEVLSSNTSYTKKQKTKIKERERDTNFKKGEGRRIDIKGWGG